MTVAHVVDSMEVGGAETVVAALARIHKAEGLNVSVHCTRYAGALADVLELQGIPVHVHRHGSRFGQIASLVRSFRVIRPSVVHCHNAAATVKGALAARIAGVSVVVSTRHGLVDGAKWSQEFKYWFIGRLFCDRVVAVCNAARMNLESGPLADPAKLRVIPNGAEPASAEPEVPIRVEKAGFQLVNVARLVPEKDHATLLTAVSIAREHIPDIGLWVIGDGRLCEQLKRLAEELDIAGHVLMLGERRDVQQWLAHADAFILSSISEGLPLSVLEAMAAGLPCILTRVGGMSEVIEQNDTGLLVEPSDPAALASAIVTYATNREHLADIGRRARAIYTQRFTPTRMAQEYLALYGQHSRLPRGQS
jgi:glycosyltransferase involved in cell wall biosynthesis